MGAAAGLDGDAGEAVGAILGGWFGWGFLLLPFHAVDALDDQEHRKGHDNKANNCVDEEPQVEGDGSGSFGCGQTMPTAMSTTLPRMANSLKSLNISYLPWQWYFKLLSQYRYL